MSIFPRVDARLRHTDVKSDLGACLVVDIERDRNCHSDLAA